jgi:hypothetical protein
MVVKYKSILSNTIEPDYAEKITSKHKFRMRNESEEACQWRLFMPRYGTISWK